MALHLLNKTLKEQQQKIALYYQKGLVAREQQLEAHVQAWQGGTQAPDMRRLADFCVLEDSLLTPSDIERMLEGDLQLALAGAYATEQGLPELSTEARVLHGLEDRVVPEYLAGLSSEDLELRLHDLPETWWGVLDAAMVAAESRVVPDGSEPLMVVRPDIHPIAALGLGIDVTVPLTADEIGALIAGRRADGEFIEGKVYSTERTLAPDERTGERKWATPIGSYDFCPTPHKSASVAWAFADEVARAELLNAHLEAAREAVGYIGEQVGRARIGDGGKDGYESGHVAWVEATHHTTRRTIVSVENGAVRLEEGDGLPGDPGIHTHFIMPNAVFCESGRVGSLDTMGIRGFIFEADLFYHARFATKARDLGYDVHLDQRTGAAVLSAVPEKANILFSKRSNAGEALARLYTAEKGEIWDDLSDDQRAARMKTATQGLDQKKKGGKDDVADFDDWKRQAKEIGWEPGSLRREGPAPERLPTEERDRRAYDLSLPWLETRLEHKAVIPHWDLRMAALRGLIETRCDGLDDIDAVTKIMRQEGVEQYGEKTALVWGQEEEKRYKSVTTALHESDEREFVLLGTGAFRNKSGAIPNGLLQRSIDSCGMDFSGQHGAAQLAAIRQVNASGKFAVVRGVPGSGKTELLKPLIASWKEMGRDVYGASLAWRQSDDLVKVGVPDSNKYAFSVLLDGLKPGAERPIKLNENSVVAVDEWGTLGTRQGLELLRAQARLGFTIASAGDDKQTASITAGSIFHLSQRALGKDNIPDILTTIRQTDKSEQAIVKLLRDGKPGAALDLKRDNGTAEMAFGWRDGVMKRVAGLYVERLKATGVAPTISAPTNVDAHQISEAVRLERRKLGLVGPDRFTIKASDGERNYQMKLAQGDRVRLYQSTRADVGAKWQRSIGRNGSVMEVLSVDDKGMRLRNTGDGRVGNITWSALRPGRQVDPKKVSRDRLMLAYGDASTVHTSQGSTAKEHIFALPSGSVAVTGSQAYVAGTRHRQQSWIVTSHEAEREEVRQSRPLNDAHEITVDDLWANVARHFLTTVKLDSAIAMMEQVTDLRRGAVVGFHRTMRGGAGAVAEVVQIRKVDQALAIMRQAVEVTRSLSQQVGLSR